MKLKNKFVIRQSHSRSSRSHVVFLHGRYGWFRSEYHAGEAAYEDISSHDFAFHGKTAWTTATCHQQASRGRNHFPDEDDTILAWGGFLLHCVRPTLISLHGSTLKERRSTIRFVTGSRITAIIWSTCSAASGMDPAVYFLDFRNDASFADRHSIIYGHHMKNGTMFTDIDKYKKQDFFWRASGRAADNTGQKL